MLAGQLADGVQIPGLGQDDADIGQRGLHQDGGHVTVGQLPFQCGRVVELRHPGGLARIDRCSDVARSRLRAVLRRDDERLVDAAVVAVAEYGDLRPPGELPGQPDRPAVGVGGRQREAPVGHAEAPGELGPNPGRVRRGQHGGGAAELAVPTRQGGLYRGGRVPGHGTGVAEAEVDELVAVDIGEAGTGSGGVVQREPAGPHPHPGHRDPAEQVSPGGRERLPRSREAGPVRRALAVGQRGQTVSVDGGQAGGHAGSLRGDLPLRVRTKRCPAAQGSAGHRGRYPIDLFLPRGTGRIRIWIENYCLT